MTETISDKITKDETNALKIVNETNVDLFLSKLSETLGYEVKKASSPITEEGLECKTVMLASMIPLEIIQDEQSILKDFLKLDDIIYGPIIDEIRVQYEVNGFSPSHIWELECTNVPSMNENTFEPVLKVKMRGVW